MKARPLVYVLNGNSNPAATAIYHKAASTILSDQADIETAMVAEAPFYIATRRDNVRAAAAILDHTEKRLANARWRRPDALVLACFGEPGLGALRELADIPMFGLLETPVRILAGQKKTFSILTPGKDWPDQMWPLLHSYRVSAHCRGIHVWPDAALNGDPLSCRSAMKAVVDRVAADDSPRAILLGGPAAIGFTAPDGTQADVCDAFSFTLSVVAQKLSD